MTHLRELNNANTAKIMAETFGRYNIFATLSLFLSLSLSLSLSGARLIRETVSPFILRAGRPRQYTTFLVFTQEKSACFLSPSNNCGG